MFNIFSTNLGTLLIAVLILWSAVWKGLGLWKSAKNNQLYWFIAMFIINTAGILPIVYIVWLVKKRRKR